MTRVFRRLPVAFALILIAAVGIFASLDKVPFLGKTSTVGYGYGGANNPATYVPVNPTRLCDTRGGEAVFGNRCGTSPLGPNEVRTVDVSYEGSPIPYTAFAVVLNVIAVDPTSDTFVSVYAPGSQPTPPLISDINTSAGSNIADLVTVATASDGSGNMDFYNHLGNTQLVVDIEGYYQQAAGTGVQPGEYHPLTPTRICDTRSDSVCGGTLAAGAAVGFKVLTPSVTPGHVAAALFNLTAVRHTTGTFLTVSKAAADNSCSVATATTSNLNGDANVDQAARILSETNNNGWVCVFNPIGGGSVDFAVDLDGWMGRGNESNAGLQFQPSDPFRLCDTRSGAGTECSGLTIGATTTVQITVAGVDGVPATGNSTSPLVVATNVAGIQGTQDTYFTLFQAGSSKPGTSDVNPSMGAIMANAGYIQLSTSGGAFNLYNHSGNINALADVAGWFVTAGP